MEKDDYSHISTLISGLNPQVHNSDACKKGIIVFLYAKVV